MTTAKSRIPLQNEIIDAVASGNVKETCMSSAKLMFRCKLASVQDLALHAMLGSDALKNAVFVSHMANRLQMTNHVRYKRDATSMHRLICEMYAVLASNYACGFAQYEVKHCLIKKVNKNRCAYLLKNYCTKDVISVIERLIRGSDDECACVDELASIKCFPIEIPVMQVQPVHCKDPMWLAWRIITEVYTCESPLSEYINNLYFLYKFRYKKQQRKERSVLMKHALTALWKNEVFTCNVLEFVCAEAAWKIQYVYAELEESETKEKDILATMLL